MARLLRDLLRDLNELSDNCMLPGNVKVHRKYLEKLVEAIEDSEWGKNVSKTSLDVKYISRIDDYDYRTSPLFHKIPSGETWKYWYLANEQLAVILSVICNGLVILSFTRVLGLHRLPSRLLVSMAFAGLVGSIVQMMHMHATTVPQFGQSPYFCKLIVLLTNQVWMLQYNNLSALLIERILACTAPFYYSRCIYIFGPVLVLAPWLLFLFLTGLILLGYYHYDLPYECMTHVNYNMPFPSIQGWADGAAEILWILFLTVVFGLCLMWNQYSGDLMEANKALFERRTTILAILILVVHYVFALPIKLGLPLVMEGFRFHFFNKAIHALGQFSAHRGIGVFMVLMIRKEFRKSLRLVFKSSAVIARERSTNLMVSKSPSSYSRSKSSKIYSTISSRMYGTEMTSRMASPEDMLHEQLPAWLLEKEGIKEK